MENIAGKNGIAVQDTSAGAACKSGSICIAQIACYAVYETRPKWEERFVSSFLVACSPGSDGRCSQSAAECIKDKKISRIFDAVPTVKKEYLDSEKANGVK